MSKRTWKVKVQQTRIVEVKVEAEDYMTAPAAALDRFHGKVLVQSNAGWEYSVVAVRQEGEPWIECAEWFEADVMMIHRAIGNTFRASDIELLEDRLKLLGLRVIETWNGKGCGMVSFKCVGRRGSSPLTKKELAILLAPR